MSQTEIESGIELIKKGLKRISSATIEFKTGPFSRDATIEEKIKAVATLLGVNPAWALAVAKVESNMGKYQRSPTGALGIFQMTSIAMKDLRYAMEKKDDEMIDICCGILFLRLLYRRWGSEGKATDHYCDPNDRYFYTPKVLLLMEKYDRE